MQAIDFELIEEETRQKIPDFCPELPDLTLEEWIIFNKFVYKLHNNKHRQVLPATKLGYSTA